MDCPDFRHVIDYVEGELDAAQAESVRLHLNSKCDQCIAIRVWYERFKEAASSDDSVEPPQWIVKRALRIPERAVEGSGKAGELFERIAQLVFDSFARPSPAGVRSAGSIGRQLLYRAEVYSIDLQIAPGGERRADLIGQVLREGDEPLSSVSGLDLELKRQGETVWSSTTNDLGEFAVSDLTEGEYDLRVEGPDLCITLVGVPVVQFR